MKSAVDSSARTNAAVLVSQFFPPRNAVASQRAMRIAATLSYMYETVFVVTLPTNQLPDEFLDFEFGKEILTNPKIQLVTASPILSGYGLVKNTNYLHRCIGALLTRLLCSTGIDWIPSLKKALLNIKAKANIKLIVATGEPFIPFCTVTNFCRNNNIPSIIDYRDLWSRNPRAPYPKFSRNLVRHTIEKWTNERATVITTVSEGCANSILAEQPDVRVEILLNFPDNSYKEKFRKSAECPTSFGFDQSKLNVILSGSVYKECTCRLLVEALKVMPKEWRDQMKLHYFGSTSKIVEHDFRNQTVSRNLIDHGFINKLEAIKAVKSADLLLSLVSEKPDAKRADVYGIMTTKVFDYFLSGKPIISIGPQGSDLNLFAEKSGYSDFHSFESSQVHELAEFLTNALRDLANFRKRHIHIDMPDFSERLSLIIKSTADAIYTAGKS